MRNLSLFFCGLFSLISLSQTKLISHKSHSGTNENFRLALEDNLFDIGDSNLGDIPYREIKNAQLDTVIYISKDRAVMKTSEFCKIENRYNRNIEDKSLGNFWKKGTDTVFNHPLFSRKHSLDSIKNVLKQEFYFKNDIEKVIFIGFDNKSQKQRKKKSETILNTDSNPDFPTKPFLILCLVLLSTIVVYFTWKTATYKTSFSN
ncbi:hypothetical protein [Flavobacterium sp.]|jgi:hypothetical protein|uniref:hypothetical protein n=1 Tax=Flavobacterium sp. TaxID=239 RepID=UPI003BE0D17C